MAKSNWDRCVRKIREIEREKKRRRRPRTPPKCWGVIYVQGEISQAAVARMREAGVRIVRS